MKNNRSILLFLLFFSLSMHSSAQFVPPGTWQIIVDEDFNGPFLNSTNPSKWQWEDYAVYGWPDIYYKCDNLAIDNPNPNLIFEIDPATNESVISVCTREETVTRHNPFWDQNAPLVTYPYTSAFFQSHTGGPDSKLYRFGYYEIRCKLPAPEYNLYSAFWFLSCIGSTNPIYSEIDVFEINSYQSIKPPVPYELQFSLHNGIGY